MFWISHGVDSKIGPAWTRLLLAMFAAVAPLRASAAQVVATNGGPSPSSSGLKISRVYPPSGALGDTIELHLDGFQEWAKTNAQDSKIAVFIDSMLLKGQHVEVHDNRVRVHFLYSLESQEVWDDLFSRPTFTRRVQIGIGKPGGEPVASGAFELVILPRRLFAISVLIVAAAFAVFVWLAMTTSIIRDPNSAIIDPRERAYSLGKLQMAVWYFLVLAAFLFVWTIKGFPPTITDQVLGLIGIASATALGSTAIDISKAKTALVSLASLMRTEAELRSENERLKAQSAAAPGSPLSEQERAAAAKSIASNTVLLEQTQQSIAAAQRAATPSPSTTFFADLLSDSDGISFHRFQILVWTLVLGFVFAVSVWRELRMPAFDTSLLALMGISGGTYLGFKFPEKQA